MAVRAFLQKKASYLPSASSACGIYVTFPVLGLEVLVYHFSTESTSVLQLTAMLV